MSYLRKLWYMQFVDAALELSSIPCRLALSEVYENITFESESP
jgi:hypothetical protein